MTEQVRLQRGDEAPDFALSDADGNTVRLRDFRGRRVVLYFYPAAMTSGCTAQACDFRDRRAEFDAAGYVVLGVSPDDPEKLRRFREQEALTFPLLSDPDKQVHTAYGAYGPKTMYGKQVTGLIRSTFVIYPDGRIEQAMYGVRAAGHVEKLARELAI